MWPGDEPAFKSFLERLALYKRAVVLSGEVHYGYTAQLSLWKKGIPRLTLPANLESALNSGPLPLSVVAAFQTGGVALDVTSRLSVREGNGEWVIVDPVNRKTYFIRKETAGLKVFEEDGPVRVGQFRLPAELRMPKPSSSPSAAVWASPFR